MVNLNLKKLKEEKEEALNKWREFVKKSENSKTIDKEEMSLLISRLNRIDMIILQQGQRQML